MLLYGKYVFRHADVSQLPYGWYYVGVKSSFQHAREEVQEGICVLGPWCLVCQAGPCELLFFLCFIASCT